MFKDISTKTEETVKTWVIELEVEQLEDRIAPDATGSLGYEGQPGNQGNGQRGYEGHPGNQGGGNHHP